MPNPIEVLLDPISLTVLALYAGLMAWEWLAPGRSLPTVRFWKLRGLNSFAVFFFLSSYPGASERVADMLRGRDVDSPAAGTGTGADVEALPST